MSEYYLIKTLWLTLWFLLGPIAISVIIWLYQKKNKQTLWVMIEKASRFAQDNQTSR